VRFMLRSALKLSHRIDQFNDYMGQLVRWLVLAAVLISAGNAIFRKTFNISSNSWLEIQWYLFSAVFLLGGGYVFLRNAHVRIDLVSSRLSKRSNAWIDGIGIVVVVFPLCIIFIGLSWPLLANAWVSGEMSQNAGGLVRWPAYALIPMGFAVLLLQAVSELIKRIAFLRGLIPEPLSAQTRQPNEKPRAEESAS